MEGENKCTKCQRPLNEAGMCMCNDGVARNSAECTCAEAGESAGEAATSAAEPDSPAPDTTEGSN